MTDRSFTGSNPQARLFDEHDIVRGWSWTVTTDRGVRRVTLPALVAATPAGTPIDWLFTEHIELLDAYMVSLATEHGALLSAPATTGRARRTARTAWRTLLRLGLEWAVASRDTGRTVTIRDANILGTVFAFAHRARRVCDDLGDRPLPPGMFDALPPDGLVEGTPELVPADPDRAGLGALWVLRTADGTALPTGLRQVISPMGGGTDPELLIVAHLNAIRAMLDADDTDRWAAWGMTADLFGGVIDPNRGDVGFDAVRLPVDDPGAATIDIYLRTVAHDVAADPTITEPAPTR
ncbi:hypothetical protein DVS28_b0372 (plasmid) [Euzebya pacifica]|uniref:Uncharacterized protein n=1 Tax=Euzebya pacifica TaxID=1608957 RepID=A0A346Y6P5_9ACTN|nr:hypothetical protein [Euzebya pacifica]AXV10142.1 hypothetical protein DVS28_b0372 [Euzebya pacifica]